jgi:hypothetical protein
LGFVFRGFQGFGAASGCNSRIMDYLHQPASAASSRGIVGAFCRPRLGCAACQSVSPTGTAHKRPSARPHISFSFSRLSKRASMSSSFVCSNSSRSK